MYRALALNRFLCAIDFGLLFSATAASASVSAVVFPAVSIGSSPLRFMVDTESIRLPMSVVGDPVLSGSLAVVDLGRQPTCSVILSAVVFPVAIPLGPGLSGDASTPDPGV